MYSWKGNVPEEEYTLPLGKAEIKKQGDDVTIIGFGKPFKMILDAAEALEKDGIRPELIDLRTVRPLDKETVFNSVRKTNRCVVVDEAWPFARVGSHIAYLVSTDCFDYLDAPVALVSSEDVPMPYNHRLELAAQPSVRKILDAVKKVLYI